MIKKNRSKPRISTWKNILIVAFAMGWSNINMAIESTSKQRNFVVGIEYVPVKIESLLVNSLSDYYLLEHLLRPLVSYNSTGYLAGDLAEKWTISDDFKIFTFTLKKNQKFSDGSDITSLDVKRSIERGTKFPNAVHYDFSNIEKVAVLNDLNFEIHLKIPNKFFIYDLESPELRVLHHSDIAAELYSQSFKITSGSYTLKQKSEKKYLLELNTHGVGRNSEIKNVEIIWPDYKLGIDRLIKQYDFDLLWGSTDLQTPKPESLGLKIKIPRLSFTYWLSFVPGDGKAVTLSERAYVFNLIHKNKKMLFAGKGADIGVADQIYLPDGPGRPTEKELENTIHAISKMKTERPKEINLLLSFNLIGKDELLQLLKKEGIKVNVSFYKTFQEYYEIMQKKNSFDLIQANNDFSYPDLRGTLAVTFNPARPLIFIPKAGKMDKEIKSILEEILPIERANKIKALGLELLSGVHIVPLFYYHSIIYHKESLDLSDWSSVTPDISLWKIKKTLKY